MEYLEKFKSYLLALKPVPSAVTVKNYCLDVKHFISWFETKYHCAFSPSAITLEGIQQFRADTSFQLSSRSLDRHVSSLRKFFHGLKLQGFTPSSPFDNAPIEQSTDPFHLKEFKDFLYVYNASNLTIKNYIIDVKQFFRWLEEKNAQQPGESAQESNLLALVTNENINAYRDQLLADHIFSASSINRKLSSLRKFIAWANSQHLLENQTGLQTNPNDIANIASTLIPKMPENSEKVRKSEIQNFRTPGLSESSDFSEKKYSLFPPLRLMQKITKGINAVLDVVFIAPLAHLFHHGQKMLWKVKGKPLFVKAKIKQTNWQTFEPVKNISKSFHNPLGMSLASFPWYRKLWHHARYTRPNWYKRYHSMAIAHYFNLAILIIVCSALGYGFYNNFVQKPHSIPTLAAAQPNRILSFQGRLTDSSNNPITSATNLRFAIYTDATSTGSALLWQEVDGVTPDSNGVFSILLGKNSTIQQSLFANNANLYLGITVGQTPELTPRQQLATVAYATNAETLQGLPPITQSGAGTSNVVLALNSAGNLSIGAASTFQTVGGAFTLAGDTLVLNTNAGTNGNITVAPDGQGFIDLQKPLINSTQNTNIPSTVGSVEVDDTLAILATNSGIPAVTINQDGAGALFTASASGVSKFTIANSGAVTDTNYTTAGGIFYADGTGLFLQTATGTSGQCLTSGGGGTPTWASCSGSAGTNFWTLANGALYPVNTTLDVLFGGDSSSSAKFAFINNAAGIPTASISGNLTLNSAGVIQTTNNQGLTVGGDTTGNITLKPLNGVNGTITFAGYTTGIIHATAGLLSSSAVNLASTDVTGTLPIANGGTNTTTIGSAGSIAYSSGTAYAFSAQGTTGQCLVSGGSSTPTWTSCSSAANNFWTENNGALYPINSTLDLFVGGSATSSAKFAVLNMTGSNTPTASVSSGLNGTATFITADGSLQTSSNQGLTIGGASTGNITLSPLGGSGYVTINGNINSNLVPQVTDTYNLGSASLEWNNLYVKNIISGGTIAGFWQRNLGVLSPSNVTDDLAIGGASTSSAKFQIFGNTGNATTAGTLTFNGNGTIQTTNNQTLTFGGNSTGAISFGSNVGSNILPRTTNTYDLGSSALQWNNVYAANIFQNGQPITQDWQRNLGILSPLNITDDLAIGGVSTSTAKFQIFGDTGNATTTGTLTFTGTGSQIQTTSNQTLTLGGNTTGAISFGSNVGSNILPRTTDTYDLGSASLEWNNIYAKNIISSGNIAGFWQLNAGALSPTNITNDVLVGGTSTSSAKFQIFANTGNATTTGTLTFDATGSLIQTTRNQGLTIGGATTGNITLSPLGGSGTVTISGLGTGVVHSTSGLLSSSNVLLGSEVNGTLPINNGGTNTTTIGSAGSVAYSDGTKYAFTAVGTSGFCLVSGGSGTPTWQSCSSAAANNFWTLDNTNGVLYPINTTLDVLFGGTSSGSANFAFINDAPGSGVPTASIAGNLTLNSAGVIATTKDQPLTIGSTTTGPIQLSPKGTTGLYVSGTGNVGINNTNPADFALEATGNVGPSATDTYDLGSASLEWNNLYVKNIISSGSTAGFWQRFLGVLSPSNITDDLAIGGVSTSSAKFQIFGSTGNATTTGTLTFTGTGSQIQTTSNQPLTLGGDTTGNIILKPNNGSGSVTVNGFINSNLIPAVTDTYDLGSTTLEWNNLYVKNIISGGNISGFWQRFLGVLSPANITDDLAIGGVSTSAAKFQIFGNTGNATSTGNLTFAGGSANNVIATRNNQGLTIGDSQTGNITITALNGGAGSTINLNAANISTDQTSVNLLNTTATTINFGAAATTLNIANNALTTTIGIGGTSGTTTVNNALTVTGILTANNNVVLGATSANTITPNGVFATSLIPQSTSVNLGSPTAYYGSAYITNLFPSPSSQYMGFWQLNAGALSPTNITNDVLVGGTSTSSAKFQIFGNTGNATTAGNLTFNGNGTIQTTNNQPLTLGGDSTGNIILKPNNGSGSVTVSGFINSNLIPTTTDTYDLGSVTSEWNNLYVKNVINNGNYAGFWQRFNGALSPINNTDDILAGGTATTTAKFAVLNMTGTNTPTASVSSGLNGAGTYITANGTLQTTNNQGLTIGGAATGNITLAPLNGGTGSTINANAATIATNQTSVNLLNTTATTINFGAAATTLSMGAGSGTTINLNAATIDSNQATVALFATPTTLNVGTTSQTTNLKGNVTLGTNNTQTIAANGQFTTSLIPNTTNTYDLGTSTLAWRNLYLSGNYDGFWQRFNGTVEPTNITDDILAGGTSTTSAKFAVLNMTGSGNPTASVSSGLSGTGMYFDSTGTIQTVRNQGLTIGGASTGNITVSPLNGVSGSSVTFAGSSAFTSGTGLTTLGGNLTVNGSTIQVPNGVTLDTITSSGTINIGTGANTSTLVLGKSGSTIRAANLTTNGPVYVSGSNGTLNSEAQLATSRGGLGADVTPAGAGELLYSNSATTYTHLAAAGTTGLCLLSGGAAAPTWASCSAASSNWWNMNLGTLFPINQTLDFTLGSSDGTGSTASAKFAVLNMTGSGTPTASVSSGLNGVSAYLTATGTLATTNMQPLTLGTTTTGAINIGTDATARAIAIGNSTGTTGVTLAAGTGNINLNAATIATNQTSVNLLNTTATTVNFASAAAILNLGATTGITTFATPSLDDSSTGLTLFVTPTTVNFGTANQTLNIKGNLTVNALAASLIPTGNGSINLGSGDHYYGTVYANNFISPVSGGVSGFWQLASSVLSPVNFWNDLAVGGNATASATPWQVFATTVGVDTAGTATSSGGLSFRGTNTNVDLLNGSILNVKTSVGGDSGLATVLSIANNGNITQTGNYNQTGSFTTSGDVAVNGGNITTTSSTGNIFVSNATTINLGTSASSAINIGNDAASNLLRGSWTIGTSATNTLDIVGKFTSSLIPNATNTYDLGTSTLAWRNIFVSGNYDGFWQRNLGVLSPYNITDDLAIGGTATSGAKFQIFANTGNATTAGTLTFTGSTATIQTTSMFPLTIGSGSTGPIQLSPKGTTGLYVDGLGNVGINTTNPTAVLDVAGAASVSSTLTFRTGSATIQATANNLLTLGGNTTGAVNFGSHINSNFIPAATDTFDLGSSTLEWNNLYVRQIISPSSGGIAGFWQLNNGALAPANITNDVLVGGVATASATFHVYGASSLQGTSPVASIAAHTSYAGLVVDNTVGDLFTASSSGLTRMQLTNEGKFYARNLYDLDSSSFFIDPSAATGTTSLAIQGNAGIGTNQPQSQLHISGTVNPLADVSKTANYQITLQNTSSTNGTGTGIAFADTPLFDNIGASIIFDRTGGNSQGELQFYTKQSATAGVAPVEAMVINNLGSVGIGVASPLTSTGLHVEKNSLGNATAVVNQLGLGDVFTASVSGTPKFVINNNGYVAIGPSLTSAQGILDVAGSGPTFPSDLTLGQTTGTNWVANPSFENAVNPISTWTFNVNTGAQFNATNTATESALFGSHALRFFSMNSGNYYAFSSCLPVIGNENFAASEYINQASDYTGTAQLRIEEYTTLDCSTGGSVTQTVSATTTKNVWQRVNATFTTASTSRSLQIIFANVTATGRAYADGFQLERSTSVSPYMDGSLGPGYYWDHSGAPNATDSSRMNGADFAYQTINSAAGIGASSRDIFPTLKLDQNGSGDLIQASVSGLAKFRVDNTGLAYAPGFYDIDNTSYFLDPAATGVGLRLAGNASSSGQLTFDGLTSTPQVNVLNNQSLGFYTSYAGGAGLAANPSLFIENSGGNSNTNGFVGVATSNPGAALDVVGRSSSATTVEAIRLEAVGSASPANPYITFYTGANEFQKIVANGSTTTGRFDFYTATGSVDTLHMILASDGSVAVGGGGTAGNPTVTGLDIQNSGILNVGGSVIDFGGSTRLTDSAAASGTTVEPLSNVFNIYNGTNDQTLHVYGTSHDLAIIYDSANSIARVTTQGGGTDLLMFQQNGGPTLIGANVLPVNSTTAPPALTVNHDSQGTAVFHINQRNTVGDLMAASESGTTKFNIDGSGQVYAGLPTAATEHMCWQAVTRGGASLKEFTDCTGTPGDLAEDYATNNNLEPGDVVLLDNTGTNTLIKTTTSYQQGTAGVVATDPTEIMANDTISENRYPQPLSLQGRVPVKVSLENGPIHAGDSLTSSSIPSVAMRATKPGLIIGTAIENYDGTVRVSAETQYQESHRLADHPDLPAYTSDPSKWPEGVGKIAMLTHISWHDPDVYLTSTGDVRLKDETTSTDFTVPHYFTLNDALGGNITRMGRFLELVVGNLRAGTISTQQLFTNSLAIATDNVSIAGQSLHDYVAGIVNEVMSKNGTTSPLASVNQLHAGIISPLGTDDSIALSLGNSRIDFKNGASGSAVASIDNVGNATFSGTVKSENLAVNSDATISGTLHAHRIEADEIAGLTASLGTLSAQNITNVTNIYFATPSGTPTGENFAMGSGTGSNGNTGVLNASTSGSLTPYLGYTNLASYSGFLAYVPNLSASTAMFDQGLMSLGATSLADTTITGQLSIGASLILADNSINVLGSTFQIQPLRQGGVSFEGGLLAIDTDGNLTVNGNAVFSKTLAANIISPLANDRDLIVKLGENPTATGAALASSSLSIQNASGSGIFTIDQLGNIIASGAANIGKLNLSVAQPALAVSNTEIIATGSAGMASVKAHQTEVTIDNKMVTNRSLIYITPVGSSNVTPYLLRQVNGASFTVGIPVGQFTDTTFNWLIVN